MACLVHLGEESTQAITAVVRERLGPRVGDADWRTTKAETLLLVVECESDGSACTSARKFMRALKQADELAGTPRRVACLALARSVCANSAAMLGADKFNGCAKVQRALQDRGCSVLLPIGGAEIELEEVEVSVLPWADRVAAALDALETPTDPAIPDSAKAVGSVPCGEACSASSCATSHGGVNEDREARVAGAALGLAVGAATALVLVFAFVRRTRAQK